MISNSITLDPNQYLRLRHSLRSISMNFHRVQAMKWFSVSLLCFSVIIAHANAKDASRSNLSISEFFGSFVGETTEIKPNENTTRKLTVKIKAYRDEGFIVDWSTVMNKIDGRIKKRTSTIAFRPSHRQGIYASAMKTDVFGNEVPLNPVQGDPFVWATLKDNTLHIHRLYITNSGGYELQSYKRFLNPEGMTVQFTRYRDGHRELFAPAQMRRE